MAIGIGQLLFGTIGAVWLCMPAGIAAHRQGQAEDAAIAEFSCRVDAYDRLHRRLEGTVPTLEVSTDPARVQRAVDALGAAIREARRDARQGDIFVPEIVALFRRVIREGCAGHFQELLEMTHEEVRSIHRPRINGPWPTDGYTYMPPNLLQRFPPLPDGLEYRFVHRDLVLWDSHANVIVDFIKDAVPASMHQ